MNSTQLSEVERKARMADILAKQAKALQTIDRLKVEASKLGKEKRVDRMLDLMAKPTWELGTGEVKRYHAVHGTRRGLMDCTRSQRLQSFFRRTTRCAPEREGSYAGGIANLRSCCCTYGAFLLLAPRAACLCAPNPTGLSVDGSRVRLRLESRYRGSLRPRNRDVESWRNGTLSGLRQQLANLFLQFIETPIQSRSDAVSEGAASWRDGKRLLSSAM